MRIHLQQTYSEYQGFPAYDEDTEEVSGTAVDTLDFLEAVEAVDNTSDAGLDTVEDLETAGGTDSADICSVYSEMTYFADFD